MTTVPSGPSLSYKQFFLDLPEDRLLQKVRFIDEKERRDSSPFALVLLNRACMSYSPTTERFLSSSDLRPMTPLRPGDFFPIFSEAIDAETGKRLIAPKTILQQFDQEAESMAAAALGGGGGVALPKAVKKTSTEKTSEFIGHIGPSVIAKPTDKGLMLLCAYYFQKYGIDITVTSSYETFAEALKGPLYKPGAKAWGIIATNGDLLRSHVTPVICYKKDEASPIEILQLDSIETPVLSVSETLREMKSEDPTYPIYTVRGSRQMDSYGCRTDALCVLKDALRLLDHYRPDNLRSYLKVIEDYGHRYSFHLPASWAKTAQLLTSIKDPLSTPVISSYGTLEAFLKAHTKKPASSISLKLPTNMYLSFKGKKLVQKIPQILEQNNSDLRRRFRHLEAFYIGPQEKMRFFEE
jgi:hypothetical protein